MENHEMSMPQYIAVAIVSNDKKKIEKIKKQLALPKSGINPEYYYLTPRDNVSNVLKQDEFKYAFIHLWITLDDESFAYAEKENIKDHKNKNYDRGFYKQLLPNEIIKIDVENSLDIVLQELRKITKEIFKAFCESS
jgi:hypothetical protein